MKRVKELGGLTIAQTPDEAEYTDMPANAIGTGLVDYVLPVAEMPARIVEYHDRLRRAGLAPAAAGTDDESEAMREVMTLLRIRTGQDFSNYKASTMQTPGRAPDQRARPANVAEYAARDARPHRRGGRADEGAAHQRDELLPRSAGVRGAPAARDPAPVRDKSSVDQLRVWTAGCATGEEAYSLAMLLLEHGSPLAAPRRFRSSPPISTSRRLRRPGGRLYRG
jgi:two-component system CheB/CheR fusion protein